MQEDASSEFCHASPIRLLTTTSKPRCRKATNGDFNAKTTTHTGANQNDPWWEVDLGAEQDLSRIVVWNRTDNNLQGRLDGVLAPDSVEFLAGRIKNSRLEFIEDAGHLIEIDQPARFVELVREFLGISDG